MKPQELAFTMPQETVLARALSPNRFEERSSPQNRFALARAKTQLLSAALATPKRAITSFSYCSRGTRPTILR